MPAGDWLKLHRCIRDSEVFSDDWLTRLWLWCLISTNYKDGFFKGEIIKRGQFATGRKSGAKELKVAESKFYRGLARLEKIGSITQKSNSTFTIVTLCNFETYQNSEIETEQPANSQRTADEQPVNTIKECNNSIIGFIHTHANGKTETNATKAGDSLTFKIGGRSEAFNRFIKIHPRPTSPEFAWECWQGKVAELVLQSESPDSQIEEMIISAAKKFRDSPAGQDPRPGGKDVRVAAAKWLLGNCFEEDPKLWQMPNGGPDPKSKEPPKPRVRPLRSPSTTELGNDLMKFMNPLGATDDD